MTGIFNKKYAIYWILALAVIVRIIGLTKCFQGDEFFSVIDARSLAAIPDALLLDTHPPLYFYLLNFWMKISASEAFLRILSIIPGIGLCLAVYLIGRYIFDEMSGIVSALLVALAPIAVWSSQYVRTYSLAAFFTVLSVYFLLRILKEKKASNADWAGYILFSAASIYTFYFSALIIIAENIYMAAYIRKKKFWLKWLLSQAAVLALYIPWLPYFFFQRSSYVSHPQMIDKVGFYIGRIHVGGIIRSIAGLAGFDPRLYSKRLVSGEGFFVALVVAFVLAGMILAIWRAVEFFRSSKAGPKEGRFVELLFFLAILPFLMALLIHQAFGIVLMSHYFIASFVFLALFFTAVVVKTVSKRTGAVILAIVILLYSSRLFAMYLDNEMDFRSAHSYIKTAMAGETFVVSPSFGGVFDHYFSDIPNRGYMEDLRTFAVLGKDVIAITYPTKFELRRVHDAFKRFLWSHDYVLASSRPAGDLIIERYVKSPADRHPEAPPLALPGHRPGGKGPKDLKTDSSSGLRPSSE